jgi:hypothetical protein
MSLEVGLAFLFNATLLLVGAYAFRRGGRPERIGAVVNLLAASITTALRLLNAQYFEPAELLVLSIDMVVAGSFFWLAATTIRFWPVWAAGFAVADLFMSVCGELLPHVQLFAYHTGLGIYAYLALGALALGTFRLGRHAEPHVRNGSRRLWLRHLEETS